MQFIKSVFLEPAQAVLGDISRQELLWLIRSHGHSPLLASRRALVIASRVRLISLIFFLCTPLWIPLDAIFLPKDIWANVALAHAAASLSFLALTISVRGVTTFRSALAHMMAMLLIPTVFYSFVYVYLANEHMSWIATNFAMGYTILPFIVVAGIGIFPLTLVESMLVTIPILLAQVLATGLQLPVFNWPSFIGSLWLLVLIAGVSTLACCSQLALMVLLVRENIRDSLTKCFSRASGQELLQFQFELAKRNHAPLSVAFLDLDHFKSINDTYGHEAGDQAIQGAANTIQQHLRASDLLMRWGGEEFVIVLPETSASEAQLALQRITKSGFGHRPDGRTLTASIGFAEREADQATTWESLIELSDSRMYLAKESGRNRMIGTPAESHQPQPMPVH